MHMMVVGSAEILPSIYHTNHMTNKTYLDHPFFIYVHCHYHPHAECLCIVHMVLFLKDLKLLLHVILVSLLRYTS